MEDNAGAESIDHMSKEGEFNGPGRFESPSATERAYGVELVGQFVGIWWDGDNVFYPARILSYEPEQDKFTVLYENDDSGGQYSEDLHQSVWKIWRGSYEQMQEYFQNLVCKYFLSSLGGIVFRCCHDVRLLFL